MNSIGLRCNVSDGRGTVVVVISLDNGELHRFSYKSPSIFSFQKNSGEILNWHRENILSLITQFKVEAIAIKKSERESFGARLRNSDIFKLYLEGVLLSLAGSIGLLNQHYYKNDLKMILEDDNILDKEIDVIAQEYNKSVEFEGLLASEKSTTREAMLSVLAIEKQFGL